MVSPGEERHDLRRKGERIIVKQDLNWIIHETLLRAQLDVIFAASPGSAA